MSTQLDVDIEVLVGELPDVQCEHSQHGAGHLFHDNGPATHYVQSFHSCTAGVAYAACQSFVHTVIAGCDGQCRTCGAEAPLNEWITILGPVNK